MVKGAWIKSLTVGSTVWQWGVDGLLSWACFKGLSWVPILSTKSKETVGNSLGYSVIFLPPCKLVAWLENSPIFENRQLIACNLRLVLKGYYECQFWAQNWRKCWELTGVSFPNNNGPILDNKQLIAYSLGLILKSSPERWFWAQNWRKQWGTHQATLQSSSTSCMTRKWSDSRKRAADCLRSWARFEELSWALILSAKSKETARNSPSYSAIFLHKLHDTKMVWFSITSGWLPIVLGSF